MPTSVFENLNQLNFAKNENAAALLGDSLSILKQIKSQSIDLIFADPPYGLGKDFGISNIQKILSKIF